MLHILTKVKIVIMSIIDSIRICVANSNESEIILIHFTNNQIIKACYKHILKIKKIDLFKRYVYKFKVYINISYIYLYDY